MQAKTIEALVKKGFLTKNEKQALNELVTDLKSTWPGLKVKVFGSKVKGIADEESDLDLLILLPCDVSESIRREIICKVFDMNLTYETNISPLIMSENEWDRGLISLLPIHAYIEEEGIPL